MYQSMLYGIGLGQTRAEVVFCSCSRLTFLNICRRALSGRHASLQIIGICLSHVVLPSPDKTLHSTICTPHMINLLAKTRQSLDVLIGKKPSMDANPPPKSKALFAQCNFAVVRSSELDKSTANQVCTW